MRDAFNIGVACGSESSEDIYSSPFFDLGTVPGDDTMPSGFNDWSAIRLRIDEVGGEGEVGDFGIAKCFDIDTSDNALEFDFI